MIETHSVNVFLQTDYAKAGWHGWLDYANGLLAPTFLWIAGYLQGSRIRNAPPDQLRRSAPKQFSRLAWIFFLAHLLHVPWTSWAAGDFSPDSWRIFLQADILQCLAISLVILLLCGLCAPIRFYDPLTLGLFSAAVFLAPAAALWHSGFLPLDSCLNRETGSLFPLFPWLAFSAAGSLMSRFQPNWRTWLPAAFVLIIFGNLTQTGAFSSTHPGFFCERLGWLILLAFVVHQMPPQFHPGWLLLAGRHSLMIYVVHLLIIHALPVPVMAGTPDKLWGGALGLRSTALVFLGLLLICLFLAWLSDQRRSKTAPAANLLRSM